MRSLEHLPVLAGNHRLKRLIEAHDAALELTANVLDRQRRDGRGVTFRDDDANALAIGERQMFPVHTNNTENDTARLCQIPHYPAGKRTSGLLTSGAGVGAGSPLVCSAPLLSVREPFGRYSV